LSNSPSFVVYIDESGDEGFVFNSDGSGSSRWLVLSAAVIRKSKDLAMVSCLKEVRELFGYEHKKPLHFVDLKHEQRIPYIRRVAALPIRTVSVLVYKPSILEPEKFQNEKYRLYRYATRLLLERVSWLCRDQRKSGDGDGTAEVIFSNRSKMSYQDIRDYLQLLISQHAVEHSRLAGLQVADAIASGVHFAVKVNRYGETETGYLSHISATMYRHRNVLNGYGLKLWPVDFDGLKGKAPEIVHLEGL
jgi:hypothetical protein